MGSAPESLAALDGAAAAGRLDGSLSRVAAMLREAATGVGETARAELARIVAATGGPPTPPATDPPALPPPPALPLSPSRSSSPRPPPRPPPRPSAPRTVPAGGRALASARAAVAGAGRWGLAFAVLAAALLLELTLLRGQVDRDVSLLLGAGRPGVSPAAASQVSAPPVAPPAPVAVGPVLGVDLRALRGCSPGAACEVRVLVRLRPQPGSRPVAWTFRILDRCSGAAHDVAGGTVVVPGGGQILTSVDTVALPAGRALAVVVLTRTPAVAASPPLLVPVTGFC